MQKKKTQISLGPPWNEKTRRRRGGKLQLEYYYIFFSPVQTDLRVCACGKKIVINNAQIRIG